MEGKKRMKLCSYCDGQIDLDVIACPYCGCSVTPSLYEEEKKSFSPPTTRSLSPKETLASLYPPPYQPKVYSTPSPEKEKEQSIEQEEIFEMEENKISLSSILLFSIGLSLFLFSLFLFFFSYKGEVVLRWDAKYWLVYLLLAAPLLFFGFRGLTRMDKIEETEEEDQ